MKLPIKMTEKTANFSSDPKPFEVTAVYRHVNIHTLTIPYPHKLKLDSTALLSSSGQRAKLYSHCS